MATTVSLAEICAAAQTLIEPLKQQTAPLGAFSRDFSSEISGQFDTVGVNVLGAHKGSTPKTTGDAVDYVAEAAGAITHVKAELKHYVRKSFTMRDLEYSKLSASAAGEIIAGLTSAALEEFNSIVFKEASTNAATVAPVKDDGSVSWDDLVAMRLAFAKKGLSASGGSFVSSPEGYAQMLKIDAVKNSANGAISLNVVQEGVVPRVMGFNNYAAHNADGIYLFHKTAAVIAARATDPGEYGQVMVTEDNLPLTVKVVPVPANALRVFVVEFLCAAKGLSTAEEPRAVKLSA